MVINGSSRHNAGQLATYLTTQAENELVFILEGGNTPQELSESLVRMERVTRVTTKATHTLYHAQINPKADEQLSRSQWHRAADVLCKELGFPEYQPRALVIHEKRGKDGHLRTHAHLVIQRYEPSQGLVRDSYNYLAHERAAQTLEREFGLEVTRRKDRTIERHAERKLSSQEVNHLIAQAWEASQTPDQFRAALEDRGLRLSHAQAGKNNRSRDGKGRTPGRSQNQNAFAVVGRSGDYYRIRPTLLHDAKGKKLNRAKMKDWMNGLTAPVPSYSQAKALQIELTQQREAEAKRLTRASVEREKTALAAEQDQRLAEVQERFNEQLETLNELKQDAERSRHDSRGKSLTPGERRAIQRERLRKAQGLFRMVEMFRKQWEAERQEVMSDAQTYDQMITWITYQKQTEENQIKAEIEERRAALVVAYNRQRFLESREQNKSRDRSKERGRDDGGIEILQDP